MYKSTCYIPNCGKGKCRHLCVADTLHPDLVNGSPEWICCFQLGLFQGYFTVQNFQCAHILRLYFIGAHTSGSLGAFCKRTWGSVLNQIKWWVSYSHILCIAWYKAKLQGTIAPIVQAFTWSQMIFHGRHWVYWQKDQGDPQSLPKWKT